MTDRSLSDSEIDLWQQAAEVKRAGQVAHHFKVTPSEPPETFQYRDK